MNDSLTIERTGERWSLRGRIDELAQLPALAADVPAGSRLHIDLEQVSYINSLGVRDWTALLRRLRARDVRVRLERCAEPMVHQMNMIEDAGGIAEVASFHAPFLCDACGWEGTLVLETNEVAPVVATGRVPTGACPECTAEARFADFIDRYFLFLGSP